MSIIGHTLTTTARMCFGIEGAQMTVEGEAGRHGEEERDGEVPGMQREVQRLLGRCLLRLQQYERLLKALLIDHELKGPTKDVEALQVKRKNAVANQSLGMLMNALFESYLFPVGHDAASIEPQESDAPAFAFKVHLELPPSELENTQAALRELVDMRNRLVHHFVDDFDLWSLGGCVAASNHLKSCYERIELHSQELRRWAQVVVTARENASAWFQSAQCRDLLIFGIYPDGTVDWASSGAVRVLIETAAKLSLDGWTCLPDAVAYIEQHHPEHTPSKYGCKGWPHLLHASRHFRLEYRDETDSARVGWYREHTKVRRSN